MAEVLRTNAVARALSALLASPEFALKDLQVERSDAGLLIRGRVSTFYHKQLAQEVVRNVADGIPVVNLVQVVERAASEDWDLSSDEPFRRIPR
jgi:hypothetical protein